MTPREFKKLVKTCRELGVKSYKGADFEFTLNDFIPTKRAGKKNELAEVQTEEIESDILTPEQLMWWSVQGDHSSPASDDSQ